MKKLMLLVALFGMPVLAMAQVSGTANETDSAKLTSWLASIQPRAGGLLDLKLDTHAVVYAPALQFGSKGFALGDSSAVDYVDLDGGANAVLHQKTRVMVALMAHPLNISNLLQHGLSFGNRLKFASLPDIEAGIAVLSPEFGGKFLLKDDVGFLSALKF